jgi:HPt (histidine-containing phosphotransfer) domain-containing protein
VLHINNNHLEKLAHLAHRIAGAAQMFGFADLSTKALKLEIVIKNDQHLVVNECAQELLNEIDQVLW